MQLLSEVTLHFCARLFLLVLSLVLRKFKLLSSDSLSSKPDVLGFSFAVKVRSSEVFLTTDLLGERLFSFRACGSALVGVEVGLKRLLLISSLKIGVRSMKKAYIPGES